MSDRPIVAGAAFRPVPPRSPATWALLAVVLALFMPVGTLAAPAWAAPGDEPPEITPPRVPAFTFPLPRIRLSGHIRRPI